MKTKTQNGLDLFKPAKQEYLEKARAKARKLLERREFITIDDVREACPFPAYLHHNLLGQVFKTDDFQFVGITQARRKSSKGRWIMKWSLKNPPVPQRWVSKMEVDDGR